VSKSNAQVEEKQIEIPFKFRAPQLLIYNKLKDHRFVTAICHRRLGKTYFAVYWLISEALRTSRFDFRGYYFSMTQKSAKLVSWNYFKQLCHPLKELGLVKYRETELQVIFWNGAIITLAGSENIENYRGIYVDAVVCDEIASWQNATYSYFEVLRPALSDRLGRMLAIGTVKGLDMLYDFYQRGISDLPADIDWYSLKLPVTSTNVLPKSEVLDLEYSLSPDAYAREMLCDFFAESPDVLITGEEVNQAMHRVVPDMRSRRISEVVFGVDVGRGHGGDPTVVYMRQGKYVEKLYSSSSDDNMLAADKISRLIKIHRPVSVFIDAGFGSGIIDRLQRLGHLDVVVEVYFNSGSPDQSCYNLRSCIYYRLKHWLKSGGYLPKDERLFKELVNQELQEDPGNRIRLASKKLISQRIGGSCNDSDALALTLYEEDVTIDYEVSSQEVLDNYMRLEYPDIYNDNQKEYDPLNYFNKDERYY